jgi:hypothetical protein
MRHRTEHTTPELNPANSLGGFGVPARWGVYAEVQQLRKAR